MLTTSPEMIQGIKTNADAFIALSRVAFSCVEQLSTLNLSTARKSLEESALVAASMLEMNGRLPSSKATLTTPLVAGESVATYLRGLNDIATEGYQETARLMTTYFASPSFGSSHSVGWFKGFEGLNGFGQNFSALMAANNMAMADVTKRAANQTNALACQSA